MNDADWKELYEKFYELYYKLLADYFLLNEALRQMLSIYNGDVTDAEKAKAIVDDARRLLDRERDEPLPFTDWTPEEVSE